MAADGSVVIKIEGDASDLKKSLQNVAKVIEVSLGSPLTGANKKIGAMAREMAGIGSGPLEQASDAIKGIGTSSEQATDEFDQLADEWDNLFSSDVTVASDDLLSVGDAADTATSHLEKLKTEISSQEKEISSLKSKYESAAQEFGETSDEARGFASEIDSVSKKLEKNKATLSDVESAAERTGNGYHAAASSMSHALDKLAKALAAVVAAAAGVGVAVAKIGSDFDSAFAQTETIMDTSQKSVDSMRAAILGLSSDMGVAASELSGTVYNAISATGDTANAVSLVADATKLATAGFTDTDSALSVLTTTINAYGLSAAAAQSISDSLIQTQNLGVTTIDALAGAMGKAISTASAYGVNLTNLESAYISLTKAGINTEESTTYLSSLLNELGDSGSKVGKIIRSETGKSFGTLMKEGKSLGDVMEILVDSVDGSSEALMNLWGSAEAGKASNAIVSQGIDAFRKNLDQLKNSAGTTAKAYSTMADTLEHKTALVKTEAQNLAISIYEQIKPALSDIADAALAFIRNFDFTQAIGAIKTFVGVLAAAGTVIAVFKAGMIATDILEFVTAVRAGSKAVEALTAITKAGTIAQTAYQAIMALTPWGAAALAIGAVASGLLIYNAVTDDSVDSSKALHRELESLNKSLDAQKSAQEELAETRASNLSGVNAEISTTERYISELRGLIDANGKVKSGYEQRAKFLAEQINTVIPGAIEMAGKEEKAYYKVSDAIEDLIFAKKKEMVLDAMKEEYSEALTGQIEANENLTKSVKDLAEARRNLAEAQANSRGDERSSTSAEEDAVRAAEKAYDEAKEAALNFQEVIDNFETAGAAKSIEELNSITQRLSDSFVEFNGSNLAEIESAVGDSISLYQTLVTEASKSWDGMSDSTRTYWLGMIEEARAAMQEQVGVYREAGGQIPAELADGANEYSYLLPESVQAIVDQAARFAAANGAPWLDSGQVLAFLYASGILSGGDQVDQAAKQVSDQAAAQGKARAETGGKSSGTAYVDSFSGSLRGSSSKASAEAKNFVEKTVAAGNAQAVANTKTGAAYDASMAAGINSSAGTVLVSVNDLLNKTISSGESAAAGSAVVGSTMVGATADSTSASAGVLENAYSSVVTGSMESAQQVAANASEIGQQIAAQLAAGLSSGAPGVVSAVQGVIVSAIVSGRVAAAGAKDVGAAIASGVAAGINSGASKAMTAAVNMARSALSAAKSELGIHSPSREFKTIGELVVQGFANGIDNALKLTVKAASNLANTVKREVVGLNQEIERIEAAAAERAAKKETAQYKASLKEKYEELGKAEVKERQKILDDIAKLQDDWNEKQLQKQEAAAKESLNRQITALEKISDEYEKAVDQVEKERDKLSSSLADSELFETDEFGNISLFDLDDDIRQIEAYGNAMLALRERGANAGLYSEILAMDMEKAQQYAKKLLSLSDDQFAAYMDTYAKKAETAAHVAESIYGPELDAINKEFKNKLPQSAGEAGEAAMDQMAAGILANGDKAVQAARAVSDAVLAELERINAAKQVQTSVQAEHAAVSAKLASSSSSQSEHSRAERNETMSDMVGAFAMAMNSGSQSREVVLNVNGKEFARATIDDIRSVEDQSPRIVSD